MRGLRARYYVGRGGKVILDKRMCVHSVSRMKGDGDARALFIGFCLERVVDNREWVGWNESGSMVQFGIGWGEGEPHVCCVGRVWM